MTEQEKHLRLCCFAGHRSEGILLCESTAKDWLRYQIHQAIAASYTSFITGMDIDVSIKVDDNTSKEVLLRLAEMMKRMAEEDEPEDSV